MEKMVQEQWLLSEIVPHSDGLATIWRCAPLRSVACAEYDGRISAPSIAAGALRRHRKYRRPRCRHKDGGNPLFVLIVLVYRGHTEIQRRGERSGRSARREGLHVILEENLSEWKSRENTEYAGMIPDPA